MVAKQNLSVNGADTQTRTGDLTLTKGALYRAELYQQITIYFCNRKKPSFGWLFKIQAWRCPTLTWGNPTLPSALLRFTSEFGMGSGGSITLWSPSKFFLSTSLRDK